MNGLGMGFGSCAGGRPGTLDLLPMRSSDRMYVTSCG